MPRGENFKGKPPTHTPGKPSNQAEVEKRVTQVYNLLILQYKTNQIKLAIMGEYGVSSSQVDRYIQEAKARLSEENEIGMEQRKKEVQRKIKYLQQRSSKDKKRADFAKGLQLEMDLFGLEAPKKIEVSRGLSISEDKLKRTGGYLGLTDEEKALAQEMVGLRPKE